jgi:chitin deacetylase
MFAISLLFSSILALGAVAHPHEGAHARHAHHVQRDLPGSWYHHDSHPAHKLFIRDATDATATLTPGTPAWVASYPSSTPDASKMPQAWKDSLAAAVAAGKIPGYAPSTIDPNLGPVYPKNLDPNDVNTVCSATYKCRVPGSIWDAPGKCLNCV